MGAFARGFAVVVLGVTVAHADPKPPPKALILVEAIGDHNLVSLQLADVATAKSSPILTGMPSGVTSHLAVDAATRRWAFSFHQLANGDPLMIDGKATSKPSATAVIVTGSVGVPGQTLLAGDPKCTSAKTACFETPLRFLRGGTVLLTKSEASSWWMWNQRTIANPKAAATPIVDGTFAKVGEPVLDRDGTNVAYNAKAGLFATTGFAAGTAPLAKLATAKKPLANPPMIMGTMAISSTGTPFYFHRGGTSPEAQKLGLIAAFDRKANKEVEVFRFPKEYPMWEHDFFEAAGTTPRMLFQHDAAYERADLYEVPVDTLKPRKFASDVKKLLDVSTDGAFVLCSAYAQPDQKKRDPKAMSEQQLVIIEIASGKIVQRIIPDAKIPKIYDARFVD